VANDTHANIGIAARCFVTGAAGFLGGELLRTLLRSGVTPDRLRCLVRNRESAIAQGVPEQSLVVGDLRDVDAVARAIDGSNLVFHLAGTIKGARREDFLPVNVDATRQLADVIAQRTPSAFLVHVSSLAAAGPSIDGSGSDRPGNECRTISAYGESKRLGELAVAQRVPRHAIVRPPVVYGPGDSATRLLFRTANAPICLVPPIPRPISIAHVRDVVGALLAVAARQPLGSTMAIDGPDRTDTHALLRAIAAACGRRARIAPMPLSIAAVAALACDGFARATGRLYHFNRDKVRELRAVGWVADSSSLVAATGFCASVRLQDGLLEVARAEGLAR
jgi:nucleoside-diphosphate-sugar epimerase